MTKVGRTVFEARVLEALRCTPQPAFPSNVHDRMMSLYPLTPVSLAAVSATLRRLARDSGVVSERMQLAYTARKRRTR